ncbi:hypothetical protein [Ulvibacterium sp.]|uniref:hypothetical protein n=1 Tax=Ulvibacterium sp. TaxID=2665914 RepID=UPI00261BEE0C|nr:hypothetical protein [Ulvibacterium sp.]
MIKKIVFAMVCIATAGLHAQNGTISPYSYFGIGDLRSASTVENQMMGGIGVYADSIHVNLQNPAGYSKLRITTYTAGMSRRELRLKSFTEEQNTSVSNLDYLALGFGLGKGLGVGFGIRPYSSVGYDLVAENNDADGALITNQFRGEGGLNKVYFSVGYALAQNLSIGATASFNFGNVENERIQSVEDVQFGTLDRRISRINGMDFNYALYYTPKIKDKYTLFASARVNTQANLTSKNSQEIGSFSLITGQNIEVLDVDLDARGLRNTDLKIPTTTTLGIGFGENMKWFLGGEYGFQDLSSFSNDFLAAENIEYQNSSFFAFGGYFIPDYDAFQGYFKRINYRAGIRYERTGMLVNDTEINNLGITFGLGLPLGRSFSNLNLGFELGRRGTTSADLIEESYFKINVGLSLNDLWFQKRKIN